MFYSIRMRYLFCWDPPFSLVHMIPVFNIIYIMRTYTEMPDVRENRSPLTLWSCGPATWIREQEESILELAPAISPPAIVFAAMAGTSINGIPPFL